MTLRRTLCQNFGSAVIPIEFKVDSTRDERASSANDLCAQERIAEADLDAAADIPDFAYNTSNDLQPEQLDILWVNVDDVFQAAKECDEHGQDENAWCSEVVQIILRRGASLRSDLQVKNV